MVLRNRKILSDGDSETLAGRFDIRRHHVDVLCGGFPCQDISNAGRRAGISGSRSGLWRYMVRAIRVVRPKYAIVENVAALLGRGMGTVLGDLAESGYDAEWDCLPAAAFGAQHERERIFVVAYPDSKGELQSKRIKQDERRRTSNSIKRFQGWGNSAKVNKNVENVFTRTGFTERSSDGFSKNYWTHQPLLGGRLYGISRRVDRIAHLGNAVVPQIVEWIGKRIMDVDKNP